MQDFLYLLSALVLVALNAFFVAAEFALIKTRPSRLDQLVREERAFAKVTLWLSQRLDGSLAACQLGITMASLGLGWVGEPAFASIVEPALHWLGIESQALLHGIAFAISFSVITGLHLIAGEQVPKIFAIREPERVALICAPLLKFFYIAAYPLLAGLSATTSFVLRRLGVQSGSEHDTPHSEEEIRALLQLSRAHGELSRTEHRLIHAVFEFDDLLCRRVMLPRGDIDWIPLGESLEGCVQAIQRTRHTRYPICDGSMDKVLGVIHMKDLIGAEGADGWELASKMRPPRYVPETMPVSKLLRHFQASHQHLAFVVDEHGTVTGMVTLENVIEQIVGPVEDEFDSERPAIVPLSKTEFQVRGSIAVTAVNERLGLQLPVIEADTLSGLLTEELERIPEVGDIVNVPGARIEILEVMGARAELLRVDLVASPEEPPAR